VYHLPACRANQRREVTGSGSAAAFVVAVPQLNLGTHRLTGIACAFFPPKRHSFVRNPVLRSPRTNGAQLREKMFKWGKTAS
jgi:hypothetical protein